MADLLAELRNSILWLTINRPERRNAITPAVLDGIGDNLARARKDASIRAVVLTGGGDQAFCAGADLQTGSSFSFDYTQPTLKFADLLREARAMTTPLIARVNGACMAGGIGLLAMCDLAIASRNARFGLPEVKVGVFPMMVIAELQELIGKRKLFELSITGKPIDADEAARIGLINHAVEPEGLDARVEELLQSITGSSHTILARGLYVLKRARQMPPEAALAFAEGQIGLLALTEDSREGQAAFREKRKPQWRHR